jgi:hypothetical protein
LFQKGISKTPLREKFVIRHESTHQIQFMKRYLFVPGIFLHLVPLVRTSTKIIPALLLCLLVQGCVGIAAVKTKTQTFPDPKISEEPMAGGLSQRDLSQTHAVVYDAAWLDSHWGKPGKVRHTGELDETWVYKFGPTWNGVVPVILVPIPILWPSGREQVRFVLRDGQVISGKQRESRSVGSGFGCSAGPCGFNFGAFSLSD